jgi:hypothetical protein
MEFKREAVIQYFCCGISALAKRTKRKSLIKTLEYDLVIRFGGDFAVRHNQPGYCSDQAHTDCVAGKATPQVEDQAFQASDNYDVQGETLVRCVDVDALCLHFLQAPEVFRFFPLAEPGRFSDRHGFLQNR